MQKKFLGLTSAVAVTTLAAAGVGAWPSAAAHDGSARHQARAQHHVVRQMLEAGLQVAPKHSRLPTTKVDGTTVNAPDPTVGLVPDPATIDWSYWNRVAQKQSRRGTPDKASFAYDEKEPAGTFGANDTQANAEQIHAFGMSGRKHSAVRVLGQLSPAVIDTDDITTTEDQGSIPLATETGIPADTDGVEVSSQIGDGPYGSDGTGSGDFDFFHLTASLGDTLNATTAGSALDTLLVVYDADGNIVAANDDSDGTFQSKLAYPVTTAGDYYVMVSGYTFFGGIPDDPFDSSSGTGAGDEDDYDLRITLGDPDSDFYAVRLHPGDVLGGAISGAAKNVVVHKFNGQERIGSTQDLSYIYPSESPLPGGGNAVFSYVAERGGWYAVSTGDGDGAYQLSLEVYRPGSEKPGSKAVQTVFLDFNGARVNTGIFGGTGVSQLSPLSSFMADWHLRSSAQDRLIDTIVATVRENLKKDLKASGLNDHFRVRILNSRDDADPFGRPNVSRVIVGGTIAQSGVATIGIAQSIDPGNFGHRETALVLLDTLSSPDRTDDASLNHYIRKASDRLSFIGTAVGNVTSHEIGHFVGSFHVDQFNHKLNLMDQGGNFPLLYGVGPDGIGGTADDPDVDFGVDTYNPNEGLTGMENTFNNSLWAFNFIK